MYCTSTDITDLYGADLLVRVADHDKDGVPDQAVVDKGIQGATELCDSYLSTLYTVPVVPTPGIVRTCAINIAVYFMALDKGGRSAEMRQRYEDAIKHLERIAASKAGLGLPPADTDGDGNPDTDLNAKRKGRIFDIGRG